MTLIKTIDFCNSKNISIFGAPWFPTHLTKQKYFPCPHYILFKKSVLNKNLDFTIENKKKLGKISTKYKINKHYGMLINFLLGRDWRQKKALKPLKKPCEAYLEWGAQ